MFTNRVPTTRPLRFTAVTAWLASSLTVTNTVAPITNPPPATINFRLLLFFPFDCVPAPSCPVLSVVSVAKCLCNSNGARHRAFAEGNVWNVEMRRLAHARQVHGDLDDVGNDCERDPGRRECQVEIKERASGNVVGGFMLTPTFKLTGC